MNAMTITEQARDGPDTPLPAAKSLKKKKSLKQLFIPSRQKSFKLRSVSSPESQQPFSAPQQSQPLPYSPSRSLSTAPAKTFSVMLNERMPDRVPDPDILQATETLWADSKPKNEFETRARAHITHNFSRSAVATQPFEDHHREPALHHDTSLGSPQTPDQTMPTISPRPLERRVTDSVYDPAKKPAVYIPKSSKSSQSPIFHQTTTSTRESRSPDISHLALQVHSARFASYESAKSVEPPLPDQCQRIPWDPVYDVRGSYTSGQSTASSYVDTASTKHSSVFTKDSAISDTTIDADYGEERKHSMTVDEAIDMYVAGFEDDTVLEGQDSGHVITEEEDKRRSARIAEAMGDSMGPLIIPPKISSLNIPTQASSTMSDEVFRDWLHYPPALLEPTVTHDRYGFRKASRDITIEAYDAWYRSYAPEQEVVHAKWLKYLHKHAESVKDGERFPPPSSKIHGLIRRGISPNLRGAAWFFYSGGNKLLREHSEHYSELVLKCQTPMLLDKDKEAIERDLHRTFPENIHFKPGNTAGQERQTPTETPIISALRRLLSAFAIHNPAVGYCQSLNFIAGLLLLFLPEEKAFWMLHIITTILLPGSHEESLEGTDIDTWVLLQALKGQNRNIWDKIGGDVKRNTVHLPDISMCTTSWFMSAFIGNLPIEGVLRVWDVLFYQGSKTLFRVALGIFRIGEGEILKIQDPMETLQVIQTLPRKMLDVQGLFDIAFSRGEVGKNWIEKKRQQRKQYHLMKHATEKLEGESRGFIRKDSNPEPLKDLHSPSVIDRDEPMPPLRSASTRSRYKKWISKSKSTPELR
ncbi:hypothetical protein MMC10_003895 [Thelotrema lepadinum]|nr:hypothetical protein [Thelotrema lepadinum]